MSALRSRPDAGESPAAAHPGHVSDLRVADTHAAAIGVVSLVGTDRLSPGFAILPILLALTTNTVSRIVFAYAAAGRRFAFPVASGLAIVIAMAWPGHLLAR